MSNAMLGINVFRFCFLLFFIFIESISHLPSNKSIRKQKSVLEIVPGFDHFKQTKTKHPVNDKVRSTQHYMMSGANEPTIWQRKISFSAVMFQFSIASFFFQSIIVPVVVLVVCGCCFVASESLVPIMTVNYLLLVWPKCNGIWVE